MRAYYPGKNKCQYYPGVARGTSLPFISVAAKNKEDPSSIGMADALLYVGGVDTEAKPAR
jgi:hypothetical protein